jgi:hypothetical protein
MIASNAATAVGFCGRPDRPRMRLVSCKPVTKGNLRGFAIVELPIGLTIFDCRAREFVRFRYGRAADRAQAHRQLVMNGELFNEMLTAHFRSERAIDAAGGLSRSLPCPGRTELT